MSTEIFFEVDGGTVAALDHGGAGHPVLLVHGSGHNAAAWDAVVAGLLPRHRVIAVDLRGHGHSTAESRTAEQYWRDLAVVVTASGWESPLLVGHSTGGYAVTAVTAAGLVEPSGICIVDGLVLDDRQTACRALGQFRTPQATEELRGTFGYGRCFDAVHRDAWIEEQAAGAATDWLNAGADPELVRAVGVRSFLGDGGGVFTRRPTTDEIAATTTTPPDSPVHPSVDVYDRITCPMTIVLARHGFYADRRNEVTTIVQSAPQRRLVEIASGHNVVMTHPRELTAAITAMTA